jgi:drug/metabolite transporter (DMT)-like permease
MRLFLLLPLTLIAFASNSIFCRLALQTGEGDAIAFTAIRLISGGAMLWVISLFTSQSSIVLTKQNYISGLFLGLYAIIFSLAYSLLNAGIGALILFLSAQITMLWWSYRMGETLSPIQWGGVLISLVGFLIIIAPSSSAPPLIGAILMIFSGFFWGAYSVRVKTSKRPLIDTRNAFIVTLPIVIIVPLFTNSYEGVTQNVIVWGVISGAGASAIGYIMWNQLLSKIRISTASIVQLFVPVITAMGGFLFLDEPITLRILVSSFFILGGLLIVLKKRAVNLNNSLEN